MYEEIENHMVVDEFWGEVEYGVPNKKRLLEERRAYDEWEFGKEEEEWI